MQNHAIAVITARGGSKGLPRKNVLPLAGVPLIVHTIRAAQLSHEFEEIVVTTDDPEIAHISRENGGTVLMRPAQLATDDASSLDVLRHALERFASFSSFALLQPTSPLRNARHIREAHDLFAWSAAGSCVSITAMEHPPQKCLVRAGDEYRPLFSREHLTMSRQKLPTTYRINGAIYLGRVRAFIETGDLFAPPLVCYEMPRLASLDIDSADDLELANILYARARFDPDFA